MQYRRLGNAGVKVSPLCLGTMMFGGPADEAEAIRIMHKAADMGIIRMALIGSCHSSIQA